MTENGDGARVRPGRRRVSVNMTCHPDTLDRLDALCAKYATFRGQVVDRLVMAAMMMVDSQSVVCITGETCRIGRKDVPAVL